LPFQSSFRKNNESMVRWRQETDLDLLRQAGELLERENERLVQKVVELTKQLLHAQGKDKDELQLRLAQLEADLAQQRKKLFGDSSEKRPRERETKERPKHPGHGPRPQPALPIEEVPHTLTPDEAGTCSLCKNPLEAWPNRFETNDEVDVVTRHFVIKRHQRQKYRCSCGASHVTAPGPDKLADGARYSLAFVAEVVVGKYVDHMPLERMCASSGARGSSSTRKRSGINATRPRRCSHPPTRAFATGCSPSRSSAPTRRGGG
jgi:transposase